MMDCTIHVGIPAEADIGPSESTREGDHKPRWPIQVNAWSVRDPRRGRRSSGEGARRGGRAAACILAVAAPVLLAGPAGAQTPVKLVGNTGGDGGRRRVPEPRPRAEIHHRQQRRRLHADRRGHRGEPLGRGADPHGEHPLGLVGQSGRPRAGGHADHPDAEHRLAAGPVCGAGPAASTSSPARPTGW